MSTIQLVRTITVAADRKALAYDLLNPDKCGGFAPVERAHLLFNVIVAIVYVQIVLHTGTFVRMNAEHVLAYAFATMFLLFGNTIFLGGVHRRIRMLRNEALNEQKERVYKSDALSLEILKFFYEHKRSKFPLLNLATKGIAVVVPAVMRSTGFAWLPWR